MRSIPDQPLANIEKSSSAERCRVHYESVEETDSVRSESEGWVMPVRRRAELVAVLSWRLVCSCMILVAVRC